MINWWINRLDQTNSNKVQREGLGWKKGEGEGIRRGKAARVIFRCARVGVRVRVGIG